MDLPNWIAKRIDVAEHGCWTWTGRVAWNGYGNIGAGSGRTTRIAHRAVYIALVGGDIEGLDLDHTCHNDTDCPGGITCPHRLCVNPGHLDPVTRSVNLKRSGRMGRTQAAQTRCKHGHPFNETNTYRRPDRPNRRQCKTCMVAANRRHLARLRGAA